ncbi:MAG: M18 family aminopeptidase, partial [Clostridia bacterium]|nr:M18 family aminopeptidase [Clostridia bacterium]
MDNHVEINGLFDFLKASPTAFHAVDSLCSLLQEQGFSPLQECKPWEIIPGGKYYVTRNRSSVIAFTLPDGTPASFRIVASHSDSPTFKIKENAELTVREKYVQLNTERYGGMIFSSWFDRPLSVAGRVLYKDENGIHTRLVKIDRDLVMIPNVAIHMNREVNNG